MPTFGRSRRKNIPIAQNRAKVADSWAGAVLHYYKITIQPFFTLEHLTMSYNIKKDYFSQMLRRDRGTEGRRDGLNNIARCGVACP